jgi:hypothetical protein
VEPGEFGVLLEFDGSRAELEAAGVRVNTQVGHVFTARVRRDEIARLRALPGLRRAQLARYAQPHLNVSAVDVRADLEHAGSGLPPVYAGRAGQGMLIGDVDSGVDFTRPDFQDGAGKTRILYIWDQTDAGGPGPAGFSYGSEWTKSQIDNTPGSVREVDSDGHGTLVAGVLVGNGSQTGCSQPAYRYVGMAPLAQFIEVKTNFSDAGIIDGVNYIFQKAAALGKDCVVNLSLGSQFSPHDGSDVFSTSVSLLTGPGRIVVASAGNGQEDNIHGKLVTTSTTVGTDKIVVNVPSYTKNAGAFNDFFLVTGWYPIGASFTIRVKGPNAADTLSVGMGDTKDRNLATNGGKIFIANQNVLYGYDGTAKGQQFEVEVYDSLAASAPRAGNWEIDVVANGAGNIGKRVDAWIYLYQLGSLGVAAKVTTGLDLTTVVGSPADGDSVFAVAAHATKASWYSCFQGGTCGYTVPPTLGAIASFSAHGPRRDGVLKPEISAPGFGVASTHSSQAGSVGVCGDADDGVHEITQGTSFSAPHVAGAAALYLQYQPGSSPSKVKLGLESRARTDAFTGSVPNATWGYGKLDIYAAIDHVPPSAAVTSPAGGETWGAGSVHSITWTATDDVAVTTVDLNYSLDGGATYPNVIAAGLANSGSYPWTVPATATTTARVRVTAHDAGGNSAAGASASNFTIADQTAPSVAVTSPVGGESWGSGSSHNVTWTASDNVGVTAVDLEYSTDGGASYPNVIATGLANSGSYPWTVPGVATATARVRVTAHDAGGNSAAAQSPADFAIVDGSAPTVTLTAPNGGESWATGSTRDILWSASDDLGVTAVDLAYSTDGGASYPHVIATGLANSGSYSWLVPATPSAAARVRVTAHDAAANTGSDASALDFAIVDTIPPTVLVLTPVLSEVVQAGTTYNVTFSASDNVGVTSFDVLYSSDGGGSWAGVATGVPASPYAWSVPTALTATARIAVIAYDAAGDSGSALGDAFVVADTQAPSVHVTAPNGGESWMEGAAHDITWSSSDNVAVDSVNVDYSLHGAPGPWLAIAHGLANSGTYSWTVPAGVTDSALVRVVAYDPSANSAGDGSDALFQIITPTAAFGPGGLSFALAAPLPNPSRSAMQFRFCLPTAGSATLEVVGVKGEIVWRRALGSLPAGPHAVLWDGRSSGGVRVPLGLYFVHLSSPFGDRTAKLVRVP